MKIAIFHFNPIEMFPPVMNFIRVLEKQIPADVRIIVFTTKPGDTSATFQSRNKQIIIRRIGLNTVQMNPVKRYFNYLRYFLTGLVNCVFAPPGKIIYYESMSALVPFVVKKYLARQTQLFIHYHEYMNELDYKGMYLSRTFHRLEKKVYARAAWISHTNKERMQLFLKDIDGSGLSNTHIFPNYPLKDWGKNSTGDQINLPFKFVYVGSFGAMESIYIKETLEWIKAQQGKITLDIYSRNIPGNITAYVKGLNCPFIHIMTAVDYYQLPTILSKYNVGLILYKAVSENFEYNAPNKLFEYLACGLDAWYPSTMKGLWEYDSPVEWPKVQRLNFEKLTQYNIDELIDRKTAARRPIHFSCEEVSEELVQKLIFEK